MMTIFIHHCSNNIQACFTLTFYPFFIKNLKWIRISTKGMLVTVKKKMGKKSIFTRKKLIFAY